MGTRCVTTAGSRESTPTTRAKVRVATTGRDPVAPKSRAPAEGPDATPRCPQRQDAPSANGGGKGKSSSRVRRT